MSHIYYNKNLNRTDLATADAPYEKQKNLTYLFLLGTYGMINDRRYYICLRRWSSFHSKVGEEQTPLKNIEHHLFNCVFLKLK